MIVSSLQSLINTPRDVRGPVWASRRFLLAEDGVGFTMTETTTEAGAEQVLWYKHHVEANYVIEGEGEVENLATGEVFALGPGSMYLLDRHDRQMRRHRHRYRQGRPDRRLHSVHRQPVRRGRALLRHRRRLRQLGRQR